MDPDAGGRVFSKRIKTLEPGQCKTLEWQKVDLTEGHVMRILWRDRREGAQYQFSRFNGYQFVPMDFSKYDQRRDAHWTNSFDIWH